MSAEAGTLDEAWAAAEAALPDGWRLDGVSRSIRSPEKWRATAWPVDGPQDRVGLSVNADSPAAALHALATALRGVPA